MNMLIRAGAMALACLPSLASAQSTGSSVQFPAGYAPGQSICVKQIDGTCVPVSADNPLPVTGGSGGGGGGDASAANQTAVQAVAGSDAAKAIAVQFLTGGKALAVTGTFWQATQPVSGTVTANLGTLNGAATATGVAAVNTTLGSPFQAGGSIGNTAFGANLRDGAGNALTSSLVGGKQRLDVVLASGVTPGSTLPTNMNLVGGTDGTNAQALRVDTRGGLLPGQGVVASTRTTLTASTATAIEAAGVSGRIAVSIFTEAALTANVYICTTQTTTCSATVYDFLIPSGAAAGTIYTPIFGTTGRLYAYSTGTPVLVLNSWTAQ